jgi:hypothetical protein
MPGFKGHLTAWTRHPVQVSSSSQMSMSRRCWCLSIKSDLVEYLIIRASIALRNGSQLLAEVFEPKTMLVARKYRFSAMKPNAPVTSGCILGKRKQAVISARARYILLFGWLTLQLYIRWSNFSLARPKVMFALNSVVLISLKTAS